METELDKETNTDEEIKEPSMYKVFILNDDYTPMDFVMEVLYHVFNKSPEQAFSIMKDAHEKGSSLVGVYSLEIAETKVERSLSASKEKGFPLQFNIEEE